MLYLVSPARIIVHCAVGVSRSASLVLAYLMIHHGYSLLDAIKKVKERRWILPNRGFLKQLLALDAKLRVPSRAEEEGDASKSHSTRC